MALCREELTERIMIPAKTPDAATIKTHSHTGLRPRFAVASDPMTRTLCCDQVLITFHSVVIPREEASGNRGPAIGVGSIFTNARRAPASDGDE